MASICARMPAGHCGPLILAILVCASGMDADFAMENAPPSASYAVRTYVAFGPVSCGAMWHIIYHVASHKREPSMATRRENDHEHHYRIRLRATSKNGRQAPGPLR